MAFKKVRITQKGAEQPAGNMYVGAEFTMTELAAASYVAQGLAEYVEPPKVEAAAVETPETAVMPKVKKRTAKKKE